RDVLGVKVVGDRAYLSIVPFETYDQAFQGLQVVDVSDPDQPVLLGSIVRGNMPWRLDVSGTRVYLGTISGFEILDVSDPSAIRSIRQDSLSIVDEVVVAGDHVYMAGDVGVVISDLDGEWVRNYSLGQSCDGASGLDVAGELIYVASECGLVIMRWGEIDGEPSLVEVARLPMRATAVRVAGAVALVSETIGMQIITTVDISDPAHPVVRDQLPSPTWATELEVRRDLLFMPSLNNGVQIFKMSLQFTFLPFARQQ
ncbi:MAG: hypothetical protein JOZ51_06245, partial [Chloroflexi bacterium]|nr:hypothetical protein [Chloroflexota bacterium]